MTVEGSRAPTFKGPLVLKARAFTPLDLSILLMDKILHDLKDPKLWELWYIPYNG